MFFFFKFFLGLITSCGGRSGVADMRISDCEKRRVRRRSGSEERGRGARVSSLKVRKAVLHDRTEGEDAAIDGNETDAEGKRLRSRRRHGSCHVCV